MRIQITWIINNCSLQLISWDWILTWLKIQRQWSSYLKANFEVTGDRGDGGLETGFFEDLSMANMKPSWLNLVRKIQLQLKFVRIDPHMFQELLHVVGPRITKTTTWFRQSIDPGLRLAITLRYLATGDSYRMLMYGFRVARNTICGIVRDVCEAIVSAYAEDVIHTPTEPEQWQAIAQQFTAKWQFPYDIGALNDKHVAIRCPKNGGFLYYNYKGYHSVVLMAFVDADYKFRWINISAQGGCSDAQIWNQCKLKDHWKGHNRHADSHPSSGDDKPMWAIISLQTTHLVWKPGSWSLFRDGIMQKTSGFSTPLIKGKKGCWKCIWSGK